MEKITWSKKQADLITAPFDHCLDWLEGTPRSGKTTAAIARFALHLIDSRDTTHLVTAYSADQAYRLTMEGDGFGLLHVFPGVSRVKHDDSGDYLSVSTPQGERKVYWKGGGKIDSSKSITGMSLGSVFFCEINLLHPEMVQECFRRTYAAKDRWHIADLNPPSPNHPVIKDVLETQDSRFIHWTARDNPILTEERLEEIKAACEKSPFLFKRDWLGERAIPEGVIYWMLDPSRHVIPKIPEGFRISEFFCAGDGGTTDATSVGAYIVGHVGDSGSPILIRIGGWFYDGGNLAMSDQARDIASKFLPEMRQLAGRRESVVLIDPACKALRLELQKFSLFVNPADNNSHDKTTGGATGLMCGIEMLQTAISEGRVLLLDSDAWGPAPMLQEFGLYCMGDGAPVDAHNHTMDELRYAHNYFAKRYGLWDSGVRVTARPIGL